MSDSLSETSILKRLIWARVMKAEEPDELDEFDEPSPPRPPRTLAPLELLLEELDELEPLPELDPTVCPTCPLTAAIVPAIGARSVVAASAFSALVTLSCALSTSAWAAAGDTVLPPPEPPVALLALPDPLALFDPLEPLAVVAVLAVVVLDDDLEVST
jgi:hypothetical protein